MKKLNTCLKVCVLVLIATVFIFGCKKTEVTDSPQTEALLIKNWLETSVKEAQDQKFRQEIL